MQNTKTMEITILVVSAVFAFCSSNGIQCFRVLHKNIIGQEDFTVKRPDNGLLVPEFYDNLSTGPEKLPIEVFDIVGNSVKEDNKEELFESNVDEETIEKAEKMADKDLLNGLNRILKNNETLKDVFRVENVYEGP